MDFTSEEFRELRKLWMKKLKDSGFKDIERHHSEYRLVQEYDDIRLRKHFRSMDSVDYYYSEAMEFLEFHSFKDETDREIWEGHVQGMTARETLRMITRRKPLSRRGVLKRLKQMKDVFKEYLRGKA